MKIVVVAQSFFILFLTWVVITEAAQIGAIKDWIVIQTKMDDAMIQEINRLGGQHQALPWQKFRNLEPNTNGETTL